MINTENEADRIIRMVRENLDLYSDNDEKGIKELIAETVIRETSGKAFGHKERENLCKTVFDSIRRLDILQELIEDDSVSEIMVNGYDKIFVERNGKITKWSKAFSSKQKLEDVIQQIVSLSNRVVNESEPIADARLPDGSRANVVLSPTALNGPILTIRKFLGEVMTLEAMTGLGSLSAEAAEFLKQAVQKGYNIFISGGTSSGKTTMLNALSICIPPDERVVTIEDSAELKLNSIDNLVTLETRNVNASGCSAITIRDLIKASLRMRPDRIVIGEVRGSEVVDMLQALNTGHEGSLSTGHANSCADMITRMEAMYLQGIEMPTEAIRRQIASGIDIMVHLERGRDGKRRVVEICELNGLMKSQVVLRTLYEEVTTNGVRKLVKINELSNTEKMNK